MPTLKTYPKTTDVRALISDEEMDERIGQLNAYDCTTTVATLTHGQSTAVVRAWLALVDAIKVEYPEATFDLGSINRDKTRAELEETVVGKEQTNRYYHPEKYDYPADQINS